MRIRYRRHEIDAACHAATGLQELGRAIEAVLVAYANGANDIDRDPLPLDEVPIPDDVAHALGAMTRDAETCIDSIRLVARMRPEPRGGAA